MLKKWRQHTKEFMDLDDLNDYIQDEIDVSSYQYREVIDRNK